MLDAPARPVDTGQRGPCFLSGLSFAKGEGFMTRTHLPLALAAAFLAASAAGAADLTKVDRTIAKEPAYKGKPKYCLLVFGPEAKSRAWLVQDGDVLYVDRNGNGDLTEKDKKVALKQGTKDFRNFEAGELRIDGLTHGDLRVSQMRATAEFVGNNKEWERVKAQDEPWTWSVYVKAERSADDKRDLPKTIGYVANGDGLGMLLFADRPQDAPIVQLNGPFSLGLQDVKQVFTAGHQTMLQIGVGTQGVGPGTFSFVLYPDTIPADAYPEAVITFPAKEAGGKPITQKFVLKERC
jgi:hypothetical protein